jgi:hypothetical protein
MWLVIGYTTHSTNGMVLLWLFVSGPVHAKPINLKGIKFIMCFPQDSMEYRPHELEPIAGERDGDFETEERQRWTYLACLILYNRCHTLYQLYIT